MNSTLNFGIMPLIVVCIPVRSLLLGRQTSNWSSLTAQQKGSDQLLDGIQIKHL